MSENRKIFGKHITTTRAGKAAYQNNEDFKMQKQLMKIAENRPLTENVFLMVLEGDTSSITAPGQFINIRLDGLYLRRPISVYDYDSSSISIIYKILGGGTEKLSLMKNGMLDVITGLGNGFDTSLCTEKPLLVGGGVGIPPLYNLAKKLISENKPVSIILGFNTKNEVFCEKEFSDLGCKTLVTTVDGSYGIKGYVTDALGDMDYSYVFSCGPIPMLRALYDKTPADGQFSFEERMGCGFGACMGCSCKTKYGYKRICKEGPVLQKSEIIW